jgi:hypothetical protein
MPMALERGAWLGRGVPPPAAACGGSSSAGRGSDSRADAVHVEEAEEGDGEVQSSLRGPFDTMDALQDSLPCRLVPPIRRKGCAFVGQFRQNLGSRTFILSIHSIYLQCVARSGSIKL